jgi:hypothetical protein
MHRLGKAFKVVASAIAIVEKPAPSVDLFS